MISLFTAAFSAILPRVNCRLCRHSREIFMKIPIYSNRHRRQRPASVNFTRYYTKEY